jgi:hypothetical protein
MSRPMRSSKRAKNIIAFQNGTACVVFFPFARELTEPERKRIDAARVIRFFVYASSEAPIPTGFSSTGTFDDYAVESLGWGIRRSTYIHSEILRDLPPMDAPQVLIDALLDLDAKARTEDHRCVVTIVADRPFAGHGGAMYRPSAPQPIENEVAR